MKAEMPADMEEGRERPPCLRAVFSLEGGEHGKEKKSCSAKVATRAAAGGGRRWSLILRALWGVGMRGLQLRAGLQFM